MCARARRERAQAWVRVCRGANLRKGQFTFTFTFIRHLGKTHNHRSRGDTPWRAQSRKGQLNRHTRYRPATTKLEKGSVESTHKVPTNLRKGQLLNDTREGSPIGHYHKKPQTAVARGLTHLRTHTHSLSLSVLILDSDTRDCVGNFN